MEVGFENKSTAERLLPNYVLGKTIGSGSFGKVKVAEHILTGLKVAVKIIDLKKLDDQAAESVRREFQILGGLTHPQIIRLYEVIEIKSKLYVVMEHMDMGDLYFIVAERGGRIPEDAVRFILQQIICGLEFCHLNMVVHRDLKPENVLVDSKWGVKLADFGLSNVIRDGDKLLRTSCGSPNYAAPEVLSGQPYSGPEVDVWSCGIIMYLLLCGRFPFEADNIPNLFKQIKKGTYTLPGHLSPGAKDMITRLLNIDPLKRITISEIRRHPWFQNSLPWYLAVPAEMMREKTKQIDEEILQEVVQKGFDRNHVIESLQNKMQNEVTVTYYLILDKQFPCYKNFFKSGSQEVEKAISTFYQQECTSSTNENNLQKLLDGHVIRSSTGMQSSVSRSLMIMIQSQDCAPEVLLEVLLEVFQELNVCCKEIGLYYLKCRWLPDLFTISQSNSFYIRDLSFGDEIGGLDDAMSPVEAIKFEIQLYKAPESGYIIDMQRISGEPMFFRWICQSLLARLQAV